MADEIRVDEMNLSDEEKRVLIRALTDKKFRDELQRRVEPGELSDEDLDHVVGGAGSLTLSGAQLQNILGTARDIETRLFAGAKLLCV